MKDPRVEQFLREHKWRFAYHATVNLADIDLPGSSSNPGRETRPLDEERATEYALEMAKGCDFPAVVLVKVGGGYTIATGITRMLAFKKVKRQTIDAYVVIEPDAYRREVLMRQLNAIEGQGLTPKDKLRQCVELIHNYQLQVKAVAEEWAIPPGRLQDALHEDALDKRALALDLMDFERLPGTTKCALGTIKNDRCFTESSTLVARHLRGDRAIEFARRVAKASAKSEEAGLGAITEERRSLDMELQRAKARHTRPATMDLTRVAGLLKKALRLAHGRVDELHVEQYSRPEELVVMLDQLNETIDAIRARLQRAATDALRFGAGPIHGEDRTHA